MSQAGCTPLPSTKGPEGNSKSQYSIERLQTLLYTSNQVRSELEGLYIYFHGILPEMKSHATTEIEREPSCFYDHLEMLTSKSINNLMHVREMLENLR